MYLIESLYLIDFLFENQNQMGDFLLFEVNEYCFEIMGRILEYIGYLKGLENKEIREKEREKAKEWKKQPEEKLFLLNKKNIIFMFLLENCNPKEKSTFFFNLLENDK